ncbi:uncharacterized protein BP5553_00431 [Venustampulla echinocandica]|uniref:Large ribosomal subunit protein mL67 n=1 Tax=Venustampulla echinocandica TaxID=2656787 RepID=A0A370TY54_9HELO|nr:uncharacterized protein BP5553_00431 [Venustampulla echinocandica]RDL40452.1 hypothetical protein BP5553_00431 [Venustampulla echinocandica]
MNARISPDLARHGILAIRGIRHATTAAAKPAAGKPAAAKRAAAPREETDSDLGRQIYVYNHLQKNHVVYSLTKAMKNNKAISQLPFNGKKTVPRALRKDLWHPLATISFAPGSSAIGLSAYQKLREYRRRHELEWDDSLMRDTEGKLIPKKKRGRQLNDQKANSIADMAAVLGRLAQTPVIDAERIGIHGEGTGERVEVRWGQLPDAEFASSWTENVVHDQLEMHINHRDREKVWGLKKHLTEEREAKQKRREKTAKRVEKRDVWLARKKAALGEGAEPEKVVL